jgi:hypothetical protein
MGAVPITRMDTARVRPVQSATGRSFIEPGSAWQTSSWSRSAPVRDEVLSVGAFDSVLEAQTVITDWRTIYNHRRPHSSLGWRLPRPMPLVSSPPRMAEVGPSVRSWCRPALLSLRSNAFLSSGRPLLSFPVETSARASAGVASSGGTPSRTVPRPAAHRNDSGRADGPLAHRQPDPRRPPPPG